MLTQPSRDWRYLFVASAGPWRPGGTANLWTWLTLSFVVPVLGVIAYAMWREPFPIPEVIIGVAIGAEHGPFELFWKSVSFDLESNAVRPLYWFLVSLVVNLLGNGESSIAAFELLHLLNVMALALFIVWFTRPNSPSGSLCCITAVACLIGMPSFRANLENLPLNHDLIILLLGFLCLSLLRGPYRARNDLMVPLICAAALLTKEQGLILPVMVAAAYLVGFRGISRTAVLLSLAILLLYLAGRAHISDRLSIFERYINVFFTHYTAQEAIEAFGNNPYPVYLYNVIATALSTLFSEPTRGQFSAIQAIIEDRIPFWQVSGLIVSAASTFMILLWGGIRTLQALRGNPNDEWRLFVVFLAVLAAGSLLGFNYTRDRLGGVTGGFYALALYFAMKLVLDRVVERNRRITVFVCSVLLLAGISSLWQARALSTVVYLRQVAWESRKGWMYDFDRRLERYTQSEPDPFAAETLMLYREQGMDPSVPPTSNDPRWIEYYFGYKS